MISETEDTIKSSKCKGQTGFLGSLSKVLVLDFKTTKCNNIVADEALDRARTVLDAKLSAIGAIGVRLSRIVFAVKETGN